MSIKHKNPPTSLCLLLLCPLEGALGLQPKAGDGSWQGQQWPGWRGQQTELLIARRAQHSPNDPKWVRKAQKHPLQIAERPDALWSRDVVWCQLWEVISRTGIWGQTTTPKFVCASEGCFESWALRGLGCLGIPKASACSAFLTPPASSASCDVCISFEPVYTKHYRNPTESVSWETLVNSCHI